VLKVVAEQAVEAATLIVGSIVSCADLEKLCISFVLLVSAPSR
jgi:hypothetical protein